jgi:hypothetical protein
MKTARITIAFFLMLFTLGAHAQDSYREALKAYTKVNPNLQGFTSDKMESALQAFNSVILQDMEEDEAEKLTNRYLNEQFWDDFIDLLMPTMQEHLTETDLKELTGILSTPEALSYTTHNMEWTNALTESLTEPLSEAFKTITAGKTPGPIKIADNIDKKYIEKFSSYAEVSDAVGQIKKGLELGAGQLPEGLMTWLNDNIPNMLVNSGYGILTEKDLDFGINLSGIPVYKKTTEATTSILDNPMEFGLSFLGSYQKWLKKQGVEVSDLPF